METYLRPKNLEAYERFLREEEMAPAIRRKTHYPEPAYVSRDSCCNYTQHCMNSSRDR